MHLTTLLWTILNTMSRSPMKLSRLKRPEYTGTNRCLPCTAVNVALAAVLAIGSAAVVAVATASASAASLSGLTIFGGALFVIYLNGYLIPGTPSLTKRYLPRRLLAAFGKGPFVRLDATFDPDETLRTVGVVIEGRDDLQLLPAFERAWRTAIDDIGSADMSVEAEITQRVASLGGFDATEIEIAESPEALRMWYGEELIATWPSRAACIADIAAADILPEYDSWWYERSLAMQAELLGALRLFLDRCPVCYGAVTLSLEAVSSCCYDYDVVATTCDGCNARLFEVELRDGLAGEGS
jgi:hypothetical protein